MPESPDKYKNLLQVFRTGLIHGIISKQEITAWADAIIMAEDEPDYFFIELSLCKDSAAIYDVIGNIYGLEMNILSTRALFGVMYQKLILGNLKEAKALKTIDSLNSQHFLTSAERASIYDLEEEYQWPIPDTPDYDTVSRMYEFLKQYKEFELDNAEMWPEINQRIDYKAAVIDLEKGAFEAQAKTIRIMAEESYLKHEVGQRNTIFPKQTGNVIMVVILFAAAIFILTSPLAQKQGLGSSVTVFFIIFAVRLINAARKK